MWCPGAAVLDTTVHEHYCPPVPGAAIGEAKAMDLDGVQDPTVLPSDAKMSTGCFALPATAARWLAPDPRDDRLLPPVTSARPLCVVHPVGSAGREPG